MIRLNVKTPFGWRIIETSDQAPVELFKYMIYWEAGRVLHKENESDFGLKLLNTKCLMVGTTLAQNGVKNHHSIYMVPRFKGGMERSLPINRATDIFCWDDSGRVGCRSRVSSCTMGFL